MVNENRKKSLGEKCIYLWFIIIVIIASFSAFLLRMKPISEYPTLISELEKEIVNSNDVINIHDKTEILQLSNE